MDDLGIHIRVMKTWWAKAFGAMFRRSIGSEVLVFVYRRPACRLFHTFFCPPLRILALTDEGNVLTDFVRRPGSFVRLPPARLVFECSPELELSPIDLQVIAEGVRIRQGMQWTD